MEMFGGKLLITDNVCTKALMTAAKFVPDKLLAFGAGLFQSKREKF